MSPFNDMSGGFEVSLFAVLVFSHYHQCREWIVKTSSSSES